ncbi:MAG: tRNA (N(6)-L-threonylcarbamoyladenosine(37)-C(2))-methylthiotransferase MtaB [Bacillota bacterium]
MPRVAFYTLGCKVNQYESEAMMDQFTAEGYRVVDFREQADIYIIQSCTVTTRAASKSRKYARRAKRRNPRALVVMTGCYPQVADDEVAGIEEVDLILGTAHKDRIVELIEGARQQSESLEAYDYTKYLTEIKDYDQLNIYEDLKLSRIRETTRAYIKIEEGCNQFCSYCIIPYARGQIRSRSPQSVVSEVEQLVDQGIKEIVLTGIHLGLYGKDRDRDQALTDLISDLGRISGLQRIRLSSLEVTEVTDTLINMLAEDPHLCPHLHLPLQSGSNRILEKMNRPYMADDFASVVEILRGKIPGIALTTDVMVGFPGETEGDFRKTRSFIQDIGFSRLHVFSYSPRPGTPAADMDNQIPGTIKNRRSWKLRELNRQLQLEYQRQFLGEQKTIIVEDTRDHQTGLLVGLTDNYLRVLAEGPDKYQEQMVGVKLLESRDPEHIFGKIIEA